MNNINYREDQLPIISYENGTMAVPAVPGAGKTFIVTNLVAKLLCENKHKGLKILILTYMNSAVSNFKGRIKKILQDNEIKEENSYEVMTIHSLAVKIIKEKPEIVMLNDEFNIADDLQKNIIFPMYRNYEDPFFFVKAMTEAKQFGAIVEDVYVYRETQGSASHQKSLESILDMLQGMWDNLKLAEKNHYCRLYALTFQRMNKESLCEIEYALNNLDTEKKLFLLLLQINASIKWDLIPDYTKCLLEPLDMIYQEYRKYEKIRNGKMVRGIRKIRSFLKR